LYRTVFGIDFCEASGRQDVKAEAETAEVVSLAARVLVWAPAR